MTSLESGNDLLEVTPLIAALIQLSTAIDMELTSHITQAINPVEVYKRSLKLDSMLKTFKGGGIYLPSEMKFCNNGKKSFLIAGFTAHLTVIAPASKETRVKTITDSDKKKKEDDTKLQDWKEKWATPEKTRTIFKKLQEKGVISQKWDEEHTEAFIKVGVDNKLQNMIVEMDKGRNSKYLPVPGQEQLKQLFVNDEDEEDPNWDIDTNLVSEGWKCGDEINISVPIDVGEP